MRVIITDSDRFDEYNKCIADDYADICILYEDGMELPKDTRVLNIMFNESMENIKFPDSIEVIRFSFHYRHPIENLNYPPNLKELHFPIWYEYSIKNIKVNEDCIFKFYCSKERDIALDNLPNYIKKLHISWFERPLYNLPYTLELLEIYQYSDFVKERINQSKILFTNTES